MEFRNRVKIIVAMICLNVKIYSTVQKMKFSIKTFLGKRNQIRSFLRISVHLLKKSFMENFIFCAVVIVSKITYERFCIC